MSIDESYNFRRIDERVTTSGVVGPRQLSALGDEGYDVVINLLPADSEHAVAAEAEILAAQGIEHVHIPVDFAAPTADDFERFVAVMEEHAGDTVHVHCAANYRVSAFYGLYAERRGRWSAAETDAFVRDLWDPSEHPAWTQLIAQARARGTH